MHMNSFNQVFNYIFKTLGSNTNSSNSTKNNIFAFKLFLNHLAAYFCLPKLNFQLLSYNVNKFSMVT